MVRLICLMIVDRTSVNHCLRSGLKNNTNVFSAKIDQSRARVNLWLGFHLPCRKFWIHLLSPFCWWHFYVIIIYACKFTSQTCIFWPCLLYFSSNFGVISNGFYLYPSSVVMHENHGVQVITKPNHWAALCHISKLFFIVTCFGLCCCW